MDRIIVARELAGKLDKMLKEWEKTRSIKVATDICEMLSEFSEREFDES